MINFFIHSRNRKIGRITVMILLFTFIVLPAFSQGNLADTISGSSIKNKQPGFSESGDSVSLANTKITKPKEKELEHSPKRAMIYSIVLPGLGQAYNKKYFKIPFVYGALIGVGYWVHYNRVGYKSASENYTNDPNSTNERYLRAWRRNLELSYITFVATDALQVLDAYVDANLFYWDVNPDLTVRVEPNFNPVFLPSGSVATNYGFVCKFTF